MMFNHLELAVLRGAHRGKISTNYGPEIEICRELQDRGYLHDVSRRNSGERIFRMSAKASVELAMLDREVA